MRIIAGRQYLDQLEVCRWLNVTEQRVRQLANKQGAIECHREGIRVWYLRESVEAYKRKRDLKPQGGRPSKSQEHETMDVAKAFDLLGRVGYLEQKVEELERQILLLSR